MLLDESVCPLFAHPRELIPKPCSQDVINMFSQPTMAEREASITNLAYEVNEDFGFASSDMRPGSIARGSTFSSIGSTN